MAMQIDGQDLRDILNDCLKSIESDGSFALSEQLTNPPNPGIYLKKGGLIGLPLNDHDAGVIVAASHAAPFGKGEKTIVDTSVRKTWELSASDFEIRNPAWPEFLESVVKKVSAGLGVDSTGKGVVAQLYKMLLYDKGAMFKPHQDSEKAPDMFATLVIALPSLHQGGEVRLTHAGRTKVFETSTSSAFDSSYLAWFADVTHEVKPVLSGRRLVLTYNLISTSFDAKSLVASSSRAMAKLGQTLDRWRKGLEKGREYPTALACMLQHQYTAASLRFDGLKGHDHQVVAHLREACEKSGFILYLANLERTVLGGCDDVFPGEDWDDDMEFHEIIEEIERDIYLQKIVDLDGKEIGTDMSWDEELLVPPDAYEDKMPDDEDYSGFTGNEGVSTTHFYHSTVALLIPRKRRMDFLLRENKFTYYRSAQGAKSKAIEWIDRLTTELSAKPNDKDIQEDLAQICNVVVRQTQKWKKDSKELPSWQVSHRPFKDQEIARVIALALDLNRKTLFAETCGQLSDKAEAAVFQTIGVGLIRFKLMKSLLPILDQHLSSVKNLADRMNIINELRSGIAKEVEKAGGNDKEVQKWLTSQTELALSSNKDTIGTVDDAIALVQLSNRMQKQEIFNTILPLVKTKMSHPAMVVAFLTGFSESGSEGEIAQDVVETVFRDLISDLSTSFKVSSLSTSDSNKRTQSAYLSFSGPVNPTPITDKRNWENFANLLCLCQKLQFSSELKTLIETLVNESKLVDVQFFEDFYLPLLKALKKLLQEKTTAYETSSFEGLFQLVLSSYIEKYVQAEPKPPADWVRPTVSCTCADCQQLNRFLSSPTERTGRFQWSRNRLDHLIQGLHRTACEHETERRGTPQTLIITKTQKEYQAKQKSWAHRRMVAKKHLQELSKDNFKVIVGEFYDPIMAMNLEELTQLATKKHDQGGASSAAPENGTASERVPPPITKRKTPKK